MSNTNESAKSPNRLGTVVGNAGSTASAGVARAEVTAAPKSPASEHFALSGVEAPIAMNSYVEEFRRAGHQAVDWVADFLANTRDLRVLPDMKPGDLIDALPTSAPEQGEPFDAILRDFQQVVMPAVTQWNHPRFFAYFACTGSTPSILAEMISAALNTNGIHWKTSPAVAELEHVTLGWLRDWMGLPSDYTGFIYDTASVSTMHAIAAAREMADPDARVNGATPKLTVYTSDQSHSSVEKDAIALGIGQNNVRKIASDAEFRLRLDVLERAIQDDLAAGKRPCCMVATVGTTSSTSVDPVAQMADLAERYNMWLHIDAAYAGSAAILPECRHILNGAERAHSLVVNAHKWLFTPLDLSAFYTRRPDILRRAFSLIPEYLRVTEDPRAINLMDYGVPLGRRFRALKLWFVLRYFGREGLQKLLRAHIAWGQRLAALVDADPRFERVAPVPFSVVCFRQKDGDEANRRIEEAINASGKFFISHTALNDRFVLRIAIGNLATTWQDVEELWRQIQALA
jgi:aromatic-L-amino-acid/L-tryptophan decarboxylase